ncbi:hypothetical protein A2V71_03990 [Candidatus Berkelbacteria bacterium RBG_13_40_8]|uniref:Uncharacterized protein n=1 Tax=Candidatus Berkelbacteria bacterium RBG_13_40_8 TaxID=1797467 RepID=A0A1F5DLI8_9BACT|nr:MAG: hypothetical protein A2V71_03990 [Candidatus Berkelbacteria bacterium RBG_13_40_8]
MFDLIGKASAAAPSSFPNLNDFVVSTNTDLTTVIRNVLSWVLLLGGAIAVIYLVYGGILYITAGGDAEKATKGRTAIVNAIIGIIIIALAYVIVQFVGNALGSVAR